MVLVPRRKKIHYKEARREGNNALAETSVAKKKKHTTLNEQLVANGQMKNQIKACDWLSKKQNDSNVCSN